MLARPVPSEMHRQRESAITVGADYSAIDSRRLSLIWWCFRDLEHTADGFRPVTRDPPAPDPRETCFFGLLAGEFRSEFHGGAVDSYSTRTLHFVSALSGPILDQPATHLCMTDASDPCHRWSRVIRSEQDLQGAAGKPRLALDR